MGNTLLHIILIFFPLTIFGQLFPDIPELEGDVERIVERRYGRKLHIFKSYKFIPNIYSGWKYTYDFNTNGQLIQRVNKKKGRIIADWSYQYQLSDTCIVEREIQNDSVNGGKGNYREEEFQYNSEGQVKRVNVWSFSTIDSLREISIVEKNIKYDSENNIVEFQRCTSEINKCHQQYELFYDTLMRVKRVKEYDIEQKVIWVDTLDSELDMVVRRAKSIPITEPELEREWIFNYDKKGNLTTRILKYYNDSFYGSSKNNTIFFKYDNRNNWIKMFRKYEGSKKNIMAKRKIKYRTMHNKN